MLASIVGLDAESLVFRSYRILVMMDWGAAYNMGRPTSIHDEEYVFLRTYLLIMSVLADRLGSMDLGLPIECDDEYWISPDGEPTFQQPPGKPSKISFFTSQLRLVQILAFALRTIVSRCHVSTRA